ncbi:SH3 domain-containing protein [Bacillus sp. 31A1R]|uniref:SH3 domain-containing protein n=1 Tax=Robertmurraya mangrovi TaxID=3098077 RepID=A0ABU5ITA5_9BACI|nr:SH3 domain-containing protein [Bacillus sp. 31A1R]MDZ5470394.1 SH3 domain-containing protein [Bacillus sp. 31A1R]
MKKVGKSVILTTGILLGGTLSSIFPVGLNQVEAASEQIKFSVTSYETTTNLNLRAGAGTQHKLLLTIPKGKTVTSTEKLGSWYKVTYKYKVNGSDVLKTGWVSELYLKKVKPTAGVASSSTEKFTSTKFKTTAGLNLRTGASTKNKTILTIPKGKVISSKEKKGNWFKVSYTYTFKGKSVTSTGWVSGTYLKEYYKTSTVSETYYFTKKSSNLYPSPDTKRKSLVNIEKDNGFLTKQKVVNSIGQTWYKVSFNGANYYIRSTDVSKKTKQSFQVMSLQASEDTFLYQSFGKVHGKISSIPKGTILTTQKSIGDWFEVEFNGQAGYIYKGNVQTYSKYNEETILIVKNYVAIADVLLRDVPNDSANPLVTIPNGSKLIPTHQTENGWLKVQYEGKIGYVHPSYLEEVEGPVNPTEPPKDFTEASIPAKTYLVTSSLEVRQAADTATNSLIVLPKNTIVIPTHKTSNNWFKVTYGGKTGYVSGTSIQEVKTGDPLNGREGYQFIDLRTKAPVMASQIDQYIASYVKLTGKASVLTGAGKYFIEAGNKYGVNALYLAAHAIHESAHGTSELSFGKNNFFGFGAYDSAPYLSAQRFPDVQSNIEFIAREMKATYLNSKNWKYNGTYLGFTTKSMDNKRIDSYSEGMNFYYATDENWGKKIAKHMENMLPFDKAYYTNASVDTTVPSAPAVPSGSDIFAADITATAKTDLILHSKKGTKDSVGRIVKDSKFTIHEKTNDFWVRVSVEGKEYWISDIKFYEYQKYLSVHNLGRVYNTSTLNVRSTPNIPSNNENLIGSLPLNTYVHIVLQKDGTLKMDSTKKWYEIKLNDGSTAWVSSSYINRELK